MWSTMESGHKSTMSLCDLQLGGIRTWSNRSWMEALHCFDALKHAHGLLNCAHTHTHTNPHTDTKIKTKRDYFLSGIVFLLSYFLVLRHFNSLTHELDICKTRRISVCINLEQLFLWMMIVNDNGNFWQSICNWCPVNSQQVFFFLL